MHNDFDGIEKDILVASDIFGVPDALTTLVQDIGAGKRAIAVSPYCNTYPSFGSEQQAYRCFQDSGGINAYIEKLIAMIQHDNTFNHVVGFSAGAAALYRALSLCPKNDLSLTLFYPGQIRYFLDKEPTGRCNIIFPKHELHFDLPSVIKILQTKSNHSLQQTEYLHGFMNKLSANFNAVGYQQYCTVLQSRFVG